MGQKRKRRRIRSASAFQSIADVELTDAGQLSVNSRAIRFAILLAVSSSIPLRALARAGSFSYSTVHIVVLAWSRITKLSEFCLMTRGKWMLALGSWMVCIL